MILLILLNNNSRLRKFRVNTQLHHVFCNYGFGNYPVGCPGCICKNVDKWVEENMCYGPDAVFNHPKIKEMGDKLYYVEYNTELNTWRLFKRNFIKDLDHPIMTLEGHPYQLANGPIQPNTIGLNNPKFLDFMVDALNEKVKNV